LAAAAARCIGRCGEKNEILHFAHFLPDSAFPQIFFYKLTSG